MPASANRSVCLMETYGYLYRCDAPGRRGAMDPPAIQESAEALAKVGFRVIPFEFKYMAARRDGLRKPPPRVEKLLSEYRDAVHPLNSHGPLFIGGKSMGGRVASMVADGLMLGEGFLG